MTCVDVADVRDNTRLRRTERLNSIHLPISKSQVIEPVRIDVTVTAIGPEKTRRSLSVKIGESTQRKVLCDPNFLFALIRPFWSFFTSISVCGESRFDCFTVTVIAIGPEKTRRSLTVKIGESIQRKVLCDPNFLFALILSLNIVSTPRNIHGSPQISGNQAKRTALKANAFHFSKMAFWDRSSTSECYQAIQGPF